MEKRMVRSMIVFISREAPAFYRLLILIMFSTIPLVPASQEILPYGTGLWDSEVFGNHRAVIRVAEKADAVLVRIPWRRRDLSPEKKAVIVVDALTQERLNNICPVEVSREFGDLAFQPKTVPGDYYVYYMSFTPTGRRNYPTVNYIEPKNTADPGWLDRHGLKPYIRPPQSAPGMAQARAVEIQSVDEFNSFFPMEVIATAQETEALLARYPQASFLLFPEDRTRSIRMADDLPALWIKSGPRAEFQGEAFRGEYYVFQIGLYACRAAAEDLDVAFSGMKSPSGIGAIPASAMTCINVRGVDWDGKDFRKALSVPKGKVQALWCGVQVPESLAPGTYEGEVAVLPKGVEPQKVKLVLDVKNEVLKDAGASELWRMSRLRWLNSRIAFDDDTLVPPFTPISVKGNTISCLGRSLALDAAGFPARITSYFNPEVTGIEAAGRDVLVSPVSLFAAGKDGVRIPLRGKGVLITSLKPGAVTWEAESVGGLFTLRVRGRMEFDGYVEFRTDLTAASGAEVSDIRLEIPVRGDTARYMMGLGFKGGFRPASFEWAWDQKKNQDALWIGDVNAGFQILLRDENYSRPLNTNFYLSKPLNLPPSWWNEGKGGVSLAEAGKDVVLVKAFSGPRAVKAGDVLHFHFNLLLTPFKPIDPPSHFKTRFFHAFKPLDEVAGTGANTINIHHANAINPFINYPFLRPPEMKAYIDEAHARGFRVKIYDTIRELSNHAVELFALRSLGDEIFSRGPAGGFSWLQEHLGSDYIAAWFVPELKDAAVINSGMSRWHNYYLEGLNWLAQNVGIDGLYIDDVAFDRTTMKRARKILDRNRPGALIDLHSANQYNVRDGFVSSAGLYMEHFPFLNRLWFGEYFDYNGSPADYWLVEVSGIPFGLMGEMLQDGGNPWRGMVFGMTNRLPWSGSDPSRLWKVWDEFGISAARMFGFWSARCPVRTDNEAVPATVYMEEGCTLVALASWAKEPARIKLKVDWKTLGLDPKKARIHAPAVPDFQEEKTFSPTDEILVEPGKGWMLVVRED
jgi:hypothetical protein